VGEPQTPLDRTSGRWDNVVPATYIIAPALRRRVHIKAFAMTADGSTWDKETGTTAPQRHGDFSECPYWCPAFWATVPAGDPKLKAMIAQMNERLRQVEATLPPRAKPSPHPAAR